MTGAASHDPGPHEDGPTALFDNGVARVETHPTYGAIIRGAVTVEVVGGAPAFVPASCDDAEIIVPDDLSELR